MGILVPAALALLSLAIPIILFYMLRLRREELSISSSLLWRRALLDRTANAPWQRLRRNLLLLLQLLLLLLLVLVLARPFLPTSTIATGNLVVVLDASASMQATDEQNGQSRFERGRSEASALVDSLSGTERMALVWAGPEPTLAIAASGSKTALHSALNSLKPSNGTTNMGSALTLAAASARQLGNATVVLISDGALAQPQGGLPRMPYQTRYVNVGKASRNLGITSLSLRDAPGGPQLFTSVFNSGSQPVDALVSFYADGKLRDSRKVVVPAGGDATATLEGLPLDTAQVEARLSVDDKAANLLGTDDRAWALRPRPPSQNVLLVSEGNSFLEKALNLMPGVKLFKVKPGDYAPSQGFGVTVLDGAMPTQVPDGNLLMFDPPNSILLPISGTISYPVVGGVDVNDPLMRFVDLSGTHIAEAKHFLLPQWARAVARDQAGDPLIVVGEPNGRRVVAVAFDLHQSDLPLQVAFPIMLTNIVQWLQPSTSVDAPPNLGAGDAISIRPMPEADQVTVTAPGDGGGAKTTTLPLSSLVSFAGTEDLGVYTVQQSAKGKPHGEPERFAVNLFSRDESNITPHPEMLFSGAESGSKEGQGQRPAEIWPWVLLAALLLLAAEWWFYNRQGGLRKPEGPRFPRLRRQQ